ncbi:inhibitor of growth protein 5-like [Babylonia areolata]|uniref:inhibitor of growth protein 5-like n=1 Tax=Babylonia areolata TaxID=304850 RepID=UPI003FD08E88
MATAMYLEQYLDSLESLPAELQRNFNLLRDLDKRTQGVIEELDGMAVNYLKSVSGLTPEKRRQQLGSIQQLFNKGRVFCDDKVQLAMQTYELVDKHIRKLDADLARFEADLKDKNAGLLKEATDVPVSTDKKKGEKDKKKRKSIKETFEDEIPKKKKKKGQAQPEEAAVQGFPLSIVAHPSDVLDMPVDPNEPTYCLCQQVSYGEMIGCDNPDCPIEWFHFACVKLTQKPKGKWFCPNCTEERKKK